VRFKPEGVHSRLFFQKNSLSLHPNPAWDVLLIQGTPTIPEEDVMIFDMSGRCVLTTRENPVDIRSLVPGSYYLRYGGAEALFIKI
jgi:hypothetical protein